MSTTEAGRLTATKPDGSDVLSFQAVIESARRLDELSCARVIGQIAEAVHAAQKAGQPLGTVTPSAIVVARDGSVKLAPGASSPRYTAPEKLRGGSGDRRADVFSLGIVLWEALAHEPLFDGAGDDAIKRAVLAGAVRPPSEYNANVPAELDAICQRALALEPANRYQSAKVMAAEIDAVLGDAGYPESNEAIATYVARVLSGDPAKPTNKTAPLPTGTVAPAPAIAPRASTGTLPPPLLGALLSPGTPAVAPRPSSGTQPPPTGAPSASSPRPSSGTQPPPVDAASSSSPATSSSAPASTQAPLSASLPSLTSKPGKPGKQGKPAKSSEAPARSSSGAQPASSSAPQPSPGFAPSAVAPPARSSSATQQPSGAGAARSQRSSGGAHPTPATGAPSSTSVASSGWSSSTGTSPSPFVATRPPAHATIVGSAPALAPISPASLASQALPPIGDARPDAWSDKLDKTEVDGAPVVHPAPAPVKPLAATAFLGSNAIASPPPAGPEGTRVGLPPPVTAGAAWGNRTPSTLGAPEELPSFEPPEMPAPLGAPTPQPAEPRQAEPRHAMPTPFRHPQPPSKESIATAATAETPHLGAPPRAAHAMSTQLGMAPPGVAPAARLPTADTEFEDERHADPAAVVALQHPEKGRDVLAGWGWSTGTTEAITDDDDFHDTARSARKRLVITIGAALAVALLVAFVAFGFSGSSKPSEDDRAAAAAPISPTAAPGSPTAAPPPPVPPPAVPAEPTPPSIAGSAAAVAAAPATGTAPGADPGAGTVAPAVAAPPPAVTEPPKAIVTEPPKAIVTEPPKAIVTEPPKAAVTQPPKTAVTEPPKAAVIEPPKAAVTQPPKTAVVEPPKTAVTQPPKTAVVEPPKTAIAPPKLAATKPPETDPKKVAAKKPAEPKRADPPKRPAQPDRITKAPPKAQPIDPYGTPDRPRPDPAVAYKSGLQQYARGDTSGALATFRGSLSSNPGFAPTWRGIGLVYEKLGNKGQARSAFKRYLQLAPGASDADQIRDRLEHLGS